MKERIQQNYDDEGALVAPVALVGNGPKGRDGSGRGTFYSNPSAPTQGNTCPVILRLTSVHLASKIGLFWPVPVNWSKTSYKGQGPTIL